MYYITCNNKFVHLSSNHFSFLCLSDISTKSDGLKTLQQAERVKKYLCSIRDFEYNIVKKEEEE